MSSIIKYKRIFSSNSNSGGGGGTWGSITGTLSSQSDLQSALNAKEDITNKATDFSVLNNTLYPTTLAVNNQILTALATLTSKPDVAYVSVSTLPANTYNNGSSGVGATLTGSSNGPLVIDGVTIVSGQVGERILVAAESSSSNNGWYTITQIGIIAVSPYILTRATESDTATEIGAGYLTGVIAPNTVTPGTNNGKVYISIATDPFTVGTTALTFSQVGGIYTNGNGISLSGSTFSIDTSVTIDKTTAQILTNKTLTSPILTGTPTSPTGPNGDNSTQVATNQFVQTALVGNVPPGNKIFNYQNFS